MDSDSLLSHKLIRPRMVKKLLGAPNTKFSSGAIPFYFAVLGKTV